MTNSRASQLPPEVRVEYLFAGNLFDQPATPKSDGPVQMHYLDLLIGQTGQHVFCLVMVLVLW